MLIFCGQEHCLIDSNGRLKLPQRFIDDFTLRCGGEVVMHGLPEGAVALYPEEVYREMREREVEAVDSIGSSFAARRSLRRFGALACPAPLTRQGSITHPAAVRGWTRAAKPVWWAWKSEWKSGRSSGAPRKWPPSMNICGRSASVKCSRTCR